MCHMLRSYFPFQHLTWAKSSSKQVMHEQTKRKSSSRLPLPSHRSYVRRRHCVNDNKIYRSLEYLISFDVAYTSYYRSFKLFDGRLSKETRQLRCETESRDEKMGKMECMHCLLCLRTAVGPQRHLVALCNILLALTAHFWNALFRVRNVRS